MPKVSKYVTCVEVPSACAFTNQVIVIENEPEWLLTVLASSPFCSWIEEFRTSFGAANDIRVSLSKGVHTFPLPRPADVQSLLDLRRQWQEVLASWSADSKNGLTQLYNAIHSDEQHEVAVRARELLEQIDESVFASYGWSDLSPGLDLRSTPRGPRYSIAPDLRREVMYRLLQLNHERYAAEIAAGLHDKKKATKAKRNRLAVGDQTTLEGI